MPSNAATGLIAPMRIATFLPELASIGGVELTMLETSRELAARGHRLSLFCVRSGNLTEEFSSFCETLHMQSDLRYSATPIRDAARILRIALGTSRTHPDLIFANNFSELAWALAARALTGAPIVCSLHEVHPIRRLSLSVLGSRVRRFIVPSRYMREAWTAYGLDPERIEVINPGIAPGEYAQPDESERRRSRERLGLCDGHFVVLYMGRLVPEKGVDVLLDAWRLAALDPDQAQLVIVGLPNDPDPYVERLRAGSPPGCSWLPMRRDVVATLHAADVLVLPSRWDEPFGRVLVEAMATGIPAVASAVGGIPEILSGQFSQMLFPREDAAALAERLSALHDWRRRDPDLGARCRDHAVSNFSLTRAVSRLETLFTACAPGAA